MDASDACSGSGSEGESDFDGFTDQDLARSRQRREERESNEANFDESDIDVDSEDSSDEESTGLSDESGSNLEWSDRCVPTDIGPFTQPCGPTHSLPDCAAPIEYFYLLLPQTFF